MTSWSQLIEKIRALLLAFEEDLANSCCQSSDQATSLPRDQATIAVVSSESVIQQLNCHDANTYETFEPELKLLKCSGRLTVPPGQDRPTSVQSMPSQLQPPKSKSSRQWEKKYKYVNKKFIVCKETRKDERDNVLFGTKETCKKELTLNDPFEFVGTQSMPASDAETHDRPNCAEHSVLFEETSVDKSSKIQQRATDDNRAPVQQKYGRQQQRLKENGLKQLAEDIADAETYSLIISQQCSTKSQNDEQTTDMISCALVDDASEPTGSACDIVANDAAVCVANEMCDKETCGESVAGIDADADVDIICMPDRHSADSDFVNDGLNTENYKNEAKPAVLLKDEQHCCSSIVAPSDLDISVKLNVDIEQLHSAHVASSYSATDSTEISENCFGRSADICHTASQLCGSQCGIDTALVTGAVEVSSDCVRQAVISTSSDVLVTNTSMQYSTSARTLYHGGHTTTVAVHSEQTLPLISVDSSDRTDVKKSYKRWRKMQQKKRKNKNTCCDSGGIKKMKSKPANVIASDVEDNSSG